ncbi:hypothetical protein TVAG_255910 [Trichomonas vaginalis G3]|uniref:DUF3447 domain-containing protein n=1 Tax=Trichomonas vaginalis (strain ATCC PRA-98 / G3) TaxID=412133 RepID=A2DYY8_TRIV3|nr:protein ubiquitination [Trichomonas vaginalis G3]EAY14399.1 hypothetical protein TVAG_255910 [Trichomonas vaginalis G3]KAI5501242.1 protein ubiquitination [Trichomonas vaginalis G3]|eukprot:XP_001326622.1 hypothetical protein [Trichomonas vaginalis G3]
MIDEEFQTKYSQIKNVYFQEFKKVEDEKLLEKFKNYSSEFQTPVLKAVMHNDEKAFISIAEGEDFDEKQTFQSCFFPNRDYSYSLLELCCYYGAVDCFKQLQTKFELKFSKICLMLSFLGGNPEIMSECLKYQIPTEECMEYAIFSHNIDFVTFLFNEYNIKINADYCCKYDNLLALFVYLDQTKALDECLKFSININIQDFCDYLIKYGANVNSGVLHDAVKLNNLKLIRFLISKGAHVNEIVYEKTPLIIACEYNYMETLSTLIQLGADPEIETSYGKTVLYRAIELDHNEIVDFLISKNINYCKKAFLMQLKETTPRSLKFSFLAGHT